MSSRGVFTINSSTKTRVLNLCAGLYAGPRCTGIYGRGFKVRAPRSLGVHTMTLGYNRCRFNLRRVDGRVASGLVGRLLPRNNAPRRLRLIGMSACIARGFPPMCLVATRGSFLGRRTPLLRVILGRGGIPCACSYCRKAGGGLRRIFRLGVGLTSTSEYGSTRYSFFHRYYE